MTLEIVTLHPDRISKPESMRGFLFKESPLRSNPKWYEWLDTQSPTLEHVMFGDATMGAYATEIIVGTAFAAEYIRMNFSEKLKAHFGAGVSVTHFRTRAAAPAPKPKRGRGELL